MNPVSCPISSSRVSLHSALRPGVLSLSIDHSLAVSHGLYWLSGRARNNNPNREYTDNVELLAPLQGFPLVSSSQRQFIVLELDVRCMKHNDTLLSGRSCLSATEL